MQEIARLNWENETQINRHTPQIKIIIPKVFGSNISVLVQEKLEGVTLGDLFRSARKKSSGLDQYLQQIDPSGRDTIFSSYAIMALEHTFMHADPHPGNIMILQNGGIGLLDWGQVFKVEPIRNNIREFAALVPTSREELADEGRMFSLLRTLGMAPEQSARASATTEMLLCGGVGTLFPHLRALEGNFASFVLSLLYLSRLENMTVEIRNAYGMNDVADPFRVMRAFKKALPPQYT